MNPARTFLAPFLAITLASLPAWGQDPSKSPAKAKKPPTFVFEDEEEGKVVKGVEVAPLPTKAREIKQYTLNHQGPTAMGVTVYIPKIVYFSDGRMRVYYSFWNRSREGQTLFFAFEECFIADAESNPYPQLARHVTSGNRGSILMTTITSDRRFDTWIDFKAPEQPTTKFKIGVMLEGRYDHRADAFRPFIIDMTEPLPPLPRQKAVQEKDEEGLMLDNPLGSAPERAGGMTREAAKEVEPDVPVRPNVAAIETVRAASEQGRRYEGSIRGPAGGSERAGIQFERRSKNRLPAATLFRHAQPLKDIWLIGAYYEQKSAPGGLIFRFEDARKVEYVFTIEKNSFTGKDTEGNIYAFNYVKQ